MHEEERLPENPHLQQLVRELDTLMVDFVKPSEATFDQLVFDMTRTKENVLRQAELTNDIEVDAHRCVAERLFVASIRSELSREVCTEWYRTLLAIGTPDAFKRAAVTIILARYLLRRKEMHNVRNLLRPLHDELRGMGPSAALYVQVVEELLNAAK